MTIFANLLFGLLVFLAFGLAALALRSGLVAFGRFSKRSFVNASRSLYKARRRRQIRKAVRRNMAARVY